MQTKHSIQKNQFFFLSLIFFVLILMPKISHCGEFRLWGSLGYCDRHGNVTEYLPSVEFNILDQSRRVVAKGSTNKDGCFNFWFSHPVTEFHGEVLFVGYDLMFGGKQLFSEANNSIGRVFCAK